MTSSNKLNRFTTLPFLIELLKTSKLVLLNPRTWEDHNDTDILLDYQEKENISGLLALCFTDQSETIHHWKAFAGGESGCCIEFNKTKLLEHLSMDKRILHKKVNYPLILKINTVEIHDVPFTKRYPYQCEAEYRIIMKHPENVMSFSVDIKLDFITKITLSPNLPRATFDTIQDVLKTLVKGHDIPINPSSLFQNTEWINGFKKRSTT